MSNVLKHAKQQQILALGRLGWSLRRIERETGIRRETISGYLRAAGIAVRSPGNWGHGPPLADSNAAKAVIIEGEPEPNPAKATIIDGEPGANPAIAVITDPEPRKYSGAIRPSACEPHREAIERWVAAGRTATSIYQQLVEEYGFPQRYSSVSRFVQKLRGKKTTRGHPVIITEPGLEGQVDYGDGPMVRDAKTGRYRRSRIFAFTLGNSRKSVWILVHESSSEIWCRLHEQAFRRLGGAPRTVVLDNLKEGVLKPDIYDPVLNPLYRDMLSHYGVVGMPARVRDPNRKGKVESAVAHAQKALRGRRFESLEAANEFISNWETRWADTRIHGTVKRQVSEMFAEEKPSLLPLPLEPFRYFEFVLRRVNLNNCVQVEGCYYSVDERLIGRQLQVQFDAFHVRIIDPETHALLTEHRRKHGKGKYSLKPEQRPKRTPPKVESLLQRSENLGEYVGKLCRRIHEFDGQRGVTRVQGVLNLARKHGKSALDDACRVAFECDAPSYRFVKNFLQRKASPQLTLKQIDPLIRELTEYRQLIDTMTQGENP